MPRSLRKLSAFVRLKGHRKRQVLRLLPAFLAVEAGLRLFPLTTLARLLGISISKTVAGPPETGHVDQEKLPDEVRRVFDTAGLFYRRRDASGACLGQSLIAGRRLRALRPQLVIGVQRDPGSFAAHAWLEIGGRPLGGPGDFVRLSGSAQRTALSR